MRDLTKGINSTKHMTVPCFVRQGEEGIWADAGAVQTSARGLAMWAPILPNKGKHPNMSEQVIPSYIVEHAAAGVTVPEDKASYPELVGFPKASITPSSPILCLISSVPISTV